MLASRSGDIEYPQTSETDVAARTPEGSLYALVVGVAEYQDSSIPSLKTTVVDATDFAQFLGGQKALFKESHVRLLLNGTRP